MPSAASAYTSSAEEITSAIFYLRFASLDCNTDSVIQRSRRYQAEEKAC